MKPLHLLLLSSLLLPASAQWVIRNPFRTETAVKKTTPSEEELRLLERRAEQNLNRIKPSYEGDMRPETRKRLHDILVKPDARQRRAALEKWLKELLDTPLNSKVAEEEYIVLQGLIVDNITDGTLHQHLFNRMLRTFADAKPVDNRDWQEHMARTQLWQYDTAAYAFCLADSINGAWPRSAGELSYTNYGRNLRGVSAEHLKATMMLWASPRDYGPLLLVNHFIQYQDLVGCLLHDSEAPERILRHKGVQRWRYLWGRDLPETVDKALVLMAARRRGESATDAQVQELFTAAAPLPGDMRGFLPRCVLAADAAACAWKPLNDPQASLYEMPDISAVTLPQWKDELLGQPADVKAAMAELEKEVNAAVADKSLPALLAFSLVEDDLSLPDNAHRPWMNVNGYDTYRAVFDIQITPDGTDVLVDEQGPHFSKNDPQLRAAYRSLNLALHRYALLMALLERDGKTEELNAAADSLATLLNTHKAWPLLWNQQSMRGVSLKAFLRLTEKYQGRADLLKAFAEVYNCTPAIDELKEEGKELTPENVSRMIHEFVISCDTREGTPQERAEVVQRELERDRKHPAAMGTLPSLRHPDLPEEILRAVTDEDICYTKDYGMRGLCTLRYALQHGDMATAERMHTLLTTPPALMATPTARLASALMARHEGKEAEAKRLEQDALVLTVYHYGLYNPKVYRKLLLNVLMQYGLVTEAERINLLLLSRVGGLRPAFAEFFAAQGLYGAAAYQMESLLHSAIRQSAPGNGLGTHRDVAYWRTAADLYRAAYLRGKGQTELADKLEQTARAAQPELAAKVKLTAPAAAEDCSTPEAARPEASPFESPFYTWHLRVEDGDEEVTQIEAKILNAAFNTHDVDESWILLRLRSGRTMSVDAANIAASDVANLKDWMQRNGIRAYESKLMPGRPFFGKPVAMLQDMPFGSRVPFPNNVRITNGKRVRFARMWGGYVSHYTESLADDQRDNLERDMQPTAGPDTQLHLFDTYTAAEADATLNERSVVCVLLGKRGSELDKAFRAMPEKSPQTVAEWNYFYSILPCYQDEQGRWEPEAQRVLDYARPLLDMMVPEGSAARERELRHGLALVMDTAGYEGSRGTESLHLRPRFVAPKAVADARIADFYAAIKRKDAATVDKMLEETPALANEPFELEYTSPLFSALFFGNHAIINSLLRHGADPNALNKQAQSVLAAAVHYPANPAIIQSLLDAGADPNGRTYDYNEHTYQTALQACRHSVPCMQVLLGAGADPTQRNGKGAGVLSLAAQSPAVVRLLQRNGKADPNECSDNGLRPLSSLRNAPPESVDILLEWGADPYLPEVDTAAAKPAPRGATNEAAEFFSEVQSVKPNNAAVFATHLYTQQFQEVLKVLVKHKIDFSRRFIDGNEVLGYLIAKGGAGADFCAGLDTLIANGADIHATYNGKPLLYLLVESGGASRRPGGSYAEEVMQTFDALVAKGLDPYAPYGEFDNVFDYAESKTTSFNRIHTRASEALLPLLTEWKEKHPKM